jgi:hypothetical protein
MRSGAFQTKMTEKATIIDQQKTNQLIIRVNRSLTIVEKSGSEIGIFRGLISLVDRLSNMNPAPPSPEKIRPLASPG